MSEKICIQSKCFVLVHGTCLAVCSVIGSLACLSVLVAILTVYKPPQCIVLKRLKQPELTIAVCVTLKNSDRVAVAVRLVVAGGAVCATLSTATLARQAS